MVRYECVRQVECLLILEAEDDEDLKIKLNLTADEVLEQADGVSFSAGWQIQREDGLREPFDVSDEDIEDAIDSASPWVAE